MSKKYCSMNAEQRGQLYKWVEDASTNEKMTYEQLAEKASVELGFSLSSAQLGNVWNAVHGKRYGSRSKVKNQKADLDEVSFDLKPRCVREKKLICIHISESGKNKKLKRIRFTFYYELIEHAFIEKGDKVVFEVRGNRCKMVKVREGGYKISAEKNRLYVTVSAEDSQCKYFEGKEVVDIKSYDGVVSFKLV